MNTNELAQALATVREHLLDISPGEWVEGDPVYGSLSLHRDLSEVLAVLSDIQYSVERTTTRNK